jgi:SAM-dependent methyltransferase
MTVPVMTSPVTLSGNTAQVGTVSTRWLVDEYDRQLGINVSRFFGDMPELSIRECDDTGYRYYYPLSVAGDADLYRELQSHPWYYMELKWEHQVALLHVGPEMSVLEVGCGEGNFLQRLPAKPVGLELNENAAAVARGKGLSVLTESIQEHSLNHAAECDTVCFFQVLEHITHVNEFIRAAIRSLRPGGRLIVSVPNSDSFIFKELAPVLNFPPHHMGLWSVNSLLGLQRIGPIQMEAALFEPLQSYHFGYGLDYLRKSIAPKTGLASSARLVARMRRAIFSRVPLMRRLLEASVSAWAPYLPGHSILVVFKKVAA